MKILAAASAVAVTALTASPALASSGNELPNNGRAMSTEHAAAHSQVSGNSSLATEPMTYHGGQVQTATRVYVVFYGAQWGSAGTNGLPTNDPAGEAPLYTKFI